MPPNPTLDVTATINYHGLDVWALPPNSQGVVTLQMLNIMEQFDLRGMGFQSAQALHHEIEAKRLAFEDRARYYADPAFYQQPTEWLLSMVAGPFGIVPATRGLLWLPPLFATMQY